MVKILKVLLLIFAAVLTVSAQCPEVIPRAGWSTRRDSRFVPVLPIRPANFFVVHAAGTDSCPDQGSCSSLLRDIQDFHMTVNDWPDISYNFMMTVDYKLYAGRGWSRIGENVEAFTNQAISVGLAGRFLQTHLSDEGMEVLNSLIECGISEGHLSPDVRVVAQCQVTRFISCEASTVLEWVSTHPRWESDPQPF